MFEILSNKKSLQIPGGNENLSQACFPVLQFLQYYQYFFKMKPIFVHNCCELVYQIPNILELKKKNSSAAMPGFKLAGAMKAVYQTEIKFE
jgi:hypothetical protein